MSNSVFVKPDAGLSLTERLMYSTVLLTVDYSDGTSGSGTGFFVSLELNIPSGKGKVPVIITNRHVLENAVRVKFSTAMQDNGSFVGHEEHDITDIANNIIFHPDAIIDLACVSINDASTRFLGETRIPYYVSIFEEQIANSDDFENLAPTMPVTMIGYPTGLFDKVNNKPIFRTGSLATHPNDKFNGLDEFLVDIACFPGSSGSPVWFISLGQYIDKFGNVKIGQTFGRLLGVLYRGPIHKADGTINIAGIPSARQPAISTPITINIGNVIRADKVLDLRSPVQDNFNNYIAKMSSMADQLQFTISTKPGP